MLPGFVEGELHKVVLYDIGSVLDLQKTDKLLEGHPSADLPDYAWGTLDYPVHRVRRWLNKDRLIKLKLNPGGSIHCTYSEPKEWQKYITNEQYQWLCQVCEVSQIYCEEAALKQVKVEVKSKKKKKRRKNL